MQATAVSHVKYSGREFNLWSIHLDLFIIILIQPQAVLHAKYQLGAKEKNILSNVWLLLIML